MWEWGHEEVSLRSLESYHHGRIVLFVPLSLTNTSIVDKQDNACIVSNFGWL